MTRTSLLASLVVGATLLPYATLWLSRSERARRSAVRFARTGWHRWLAAAGATLALSTLAASGGGLLPMPPVPLAWAAVTLSLVVYAHVEVLTAAAAMRAYPDDRVLHFDLRRPPTWPATGWRIYATWGYLMTTRYPWLRAAFLSCAVLWLVGGQFLRPELAVALAADHAVLGLSCAHARVADRTTPRERLGSRLE